jgi:flavorubredoxin
MELPIRMLEPERIAPDTYVIRQLGGEGVNPVAVHLNSMVITGEEPVIVDTGVSLTQESWMDATFSIVDPADVRWIYISHDDHDHIGNLPQVLDLCPNATLVSTWFMVERLAGDVPLPLDRMRWVNDGESFRVGDRDLVAVTPPVFDSPTSRGLYDPRTGVYWAVDALGNPLTHEVSDISELDPGFYQEGFLMFARIISPWHQWLDPARYQAHLDRVHGLGATVVASAHGTTLRGAQIDAAYGLMSQVAHLPASPLPGQADLEAILATMTAAPEQPVLQPIAA